MTPARPMFPLGSVLLPGGVLPLHVFEPRYRELVRTCLDGDGEFGVVLIERGSEVGGDDVRSGFGTMAGIIEAQEAADGRWGLLAVGLRRVRVVEWLPDDPFPRAVVEDWPDGPTVDDRTEQVTEVTALLRRVLALAAEAGDDAAPATVELADDPDVAAWQLAVLAPVGPHDRQRLLGAPDAEQRLHLLADLLTDAAEVLELRLGSDGR